jgi:ketosteroid isomerase-like protein
MSEGALAPVSGPASFPFETAAISLHEAASIEPISLHAAASIAPAFDEPAFDHRRLLAPPPAPELVPASFDSGTEAEMPAPLPEFRRLAPLPQPARRDATETRERVPRPRWWIAAAAVAALTLAAIFFGYRSAGPRPSPERSAGSLEQHSPAAPKSSPAPAAVPQPEAPTVKEAVGKAVDNWVRALRSGDPDRIAACYAPEMERYFTIHNASSAIVRRTVNESISRYGAPAVLRISELSIIPLSDTRAIATFRKHWQTARRKVYAGEEQERLTFAKIHDAWRIASEQETRVFWTQRPR